MFWQAVAKKEAATKFDLPDETITKTVDVGVIRSRPAGESADGGPPKKRRIDLSTAVATDSKASSSTEKPQ